MPSVSVCITASQWVGLYLFLRGGVQRPTPRRAQCWLWAQCGPDCLSVSRRLGQWRRLTEAREGGFQDPVVTIHVRVAGKKIQYLEKQQCRPLLDRSQSMVKKRNKYQKEKN